MRSAAHRLERSWIIFQPQSVLLLPPKASTSASTVEVVLGREMSVTNNYQEQWLISGWLLTPFKYKEKIIVRTVGVSMYCNVYLSGLVGRRWIEVGRVSFMQGWSWLLLTVQMDEPLSLPTLLSLWALALVLPCKNTRQDYIECAFFYSLTLKIEDPLHIISNFKVVNID